MRMLDLIAKKKNGLALQEKEIEFIVSEFTANTIPDYQMSAFLMAVCFVGLSKEETSCLTNCMARSGSMVDLRGIAGVKVDKHSTGGVGDKTTLIVSPIVASLGVPVAKMSGRGLGHTGGTIDKLEAIPNLKTAFSKEEFIDIVNRVGVCVSGQSGNLVPADKKIYALRDVTATVDNRSLIASSIMSKKIAAGSDCILLDVKTGSGAFMKTLDASIELAQEMVAIGETAGRKTAALITDMDTPLGFAIGNTLEIIEGIDVLRGKGPEDLRLVCVALAKHMLALAGKGSLEDCERLVLDTLASGAAFRKFVEMVAAQGGDTRVVEDCSLFEKAAVTVEVKALNDGYLATMDTEGYGVASCLLGAGRETEISVIDYSAGILLHAKTGDFVKKGDSIATLFTSDLAKAQMAGVKLRESVWFSKNKPVMNPLIYAFVNKEGVVRY